jgi:hypothetical protein
MGPDLMNNTGHTEWADGLCQQSGITTTFTPNTNVTYVHAGSTYDIDFISYREGTHATRIAYAALTPRSYHAGAVTVALMDGAARTVNEDIDLLVWRAAGTRNGDETIRLQ